MTRQILATSLLCTAIAASACNRGQETTATTPEVQTQAAKPASNMPMTVAGCVKAGDAPDTYVLTTARAEGGGDTATYQLVGEQTTGLRDHIGRRVEVSGTVEAQQEIASRQTAAAEPKDNERATGTSGTPTVQTKTEIDIKRMSVSSIKPLNDKCDM